MVNNKLENVGLELDQIIGSPLMSLVQAEEHAAEATADFIRRVGFKDSDKNNWGQLSTVTFKYKKSVNGLIKNYEVNIPILSLVPIPILQIEKAELEFSLKIADFVKTHSETNGTKKGGNPSGAADGPFLLKNDPMTIKATISSNQKSTGSYTQREMRVKMKLIQSDLPAGIARLSHLLDQSITEVPTTDDDENG